MKRTWEIANFCRFCEVRLKEAYADIAKLAMKVDEDGKAEGKEEVEEEEQERSKNSAVSYESGGGSRGQRQSGDVESGERGESLNRSKDSDGDQAEEEERVERCVNVLGQVRVWAREMTGARWATADHDWTAACL